MMIDTPRRFLGGAAQATDAGAVTGVSARAG
jgi:hypothetical protein